MLRLQPLLQLDGRNRTADQITLRHTATTLAQKIDLLYGFYAFGYHLDAQIVGHYFSLGV
ncbi:hypothetical protein ABA45_17320 [Marinobacter psychrophilus]|uniref:Uncharacterized protein n=1 Tax=Marinobacter psychrophilus TaxID=330734 RepID=A0A0H4I8B0_9GAMM|nr:hypothetical protein ABA45_17320 [Marinobacter psychrophilus]